MLLEQEVGTIPVHTRWYVLTLVSVFLALGMGMMLGAVLPQARGLAERQMQWIVRLEEEFSQLREENRRLLRRIEWLEGELSDRDDRLHRLAAEAVAGRLRDRRIGIREWGSVPPEARELVLEFLQFAEADLIRSPFDGESLDALIVLRGPEGAAGFGTWVEELTEEYGNVLVISEDSLQPATSPSPWDHIPQLDFIAAPEWGPQLVFTLLNLMGPFEISEDIANEELFNEGLSKGNVPE